MTNAGDIETVDLELIRPGPSHGQLLSPLTPYLALCGDESPVTLQIEFEHWKLLNRLERLRYVTRDGRRGGMIAVPNSSRQAEVAELGQDVGKIFAAIPTLGRELGRAAGLESRLVHLRLIISGSELSLIPFELVESPIGYPGSGLPLLLQPETPIAITREVRRGRSVPVRWNREPRILFISAAPAGMHVPVREHVGALRRVLEPWITWKDNPEERLTEVKKHLTILTDATLKDIKDACAATEYTHVHILAHGGGHKVGGQQQYGLVLAKQGDPNGAQVISGITVAEVLRTRYKDRRGHSEPLVVSLATCDSGNLGSVVAPGASIAHDLHVHGVPWVFASQFPLTKRGSIAFTEQLYEGLLWGADPRLLVRDLRQEMYVARRHDHDWASMVAYACVPPEFQRSIERFVSRQYQRAIDNDLNRASAEHDKGDAHGYSRWLKTARARIERWKRLLPKDEDEAGRSACAECYGVEGATEKKIAQSHHDAGKPDEATKALNASLAAYRRSLQVKPNAHWPATQYLSLSAILAQNPDPPLWESTHARALTEAEHSRGMDKAWAHGTLAELELLRVHHRKRSLTKGEIVQVVEGHCDQIVQLVGWESFAVQSTRRQFLRYVEWWDKGSWRAIAKAAVRSLTRPLVE